MPRPITFLILIVASNPVSGAEPDFQSERARTALQAYEAAVDEAREAYIAELELAIMEAGGQGDLDEANLLSEAKESLELESTQGESDPVRLFARELENTRWVTGPGRFNRFRPGNRTVNHNGDEGVWMASDEKTAVMQVFRTSSVFVFKFDDDLQSATMFKFDRDPNYRVSAERR